MHARGVERRGPRDFLRHAQPVRLVERERQRSGSGLASREETTPQVIAEAIPSRSNRLDQCK